MLLSLVLLAERLAVSLQVGRQSLQVGWAKFDQLCLKLGLHEVAYNWQLLSVIRCHHHPTLPDRYQSLVYDQVVEHVQRDAGGNTES